MGGDTVKLQVIWDTITQSGAIIAWSNISLYYIKESICHQWIPLTKASDMEHVFSDLCAWTKSWATNRDAGNLRCHLAHYDINVMVFMWHHSNPDSKVYGANMGPTWVLLVPDGPHVGPMHLATREYLCSWWAVWWRREALPIICVHSVGCWVCTQQWWVFPWGVICWFRPPHV